MFPWALLVLFLSLGTEIQLSHATVFSVNGTDDKLCLYADLMMNFSVTYKVAEDKTKTVLFELPDNAKTDGSICDNTSSTLKLSFGTGNSWTVTFSKSDKTYQADAIVFEYNLSDTTLFPDSIANGTASVTVKDPITNVGMDTCYSCKSQVVLPADAVEQTLWNVLIQAFVSDGNKSDIVTPCAADMPTTVAPTTSAATTVAPTTSAGNGTTAAPATTTPIVPTTTPTPTLSPPVTGTYVIQPVNGSACLLANFGLRLSFKQGEKLQEMNVDPNMTIASGACGTNTSDLVLTSDNITIMFTFTNETNKFHLHALNVTGVFSGENSNLSLWQAAVGSSYMCNKQQSFNITDSLTLYTFELRVQPFAVNKGVFSTAHECSMDDTSILIPIIVGAALAGLILIVVIAYVIGRRKTYVGYQTL